MSIGSTNGESYLDCDKEEKFEENVRATDEVSRNRAAPGGIALAAAVLRSHDLREMACDWPTLTL
jgi:hypothetical protein